MSILSRSQYKNSILSLRDIRILPEPTPAPVQFWQEMEQNGEIKIKDEVKEELSGESCQGRRDTMIVFFSPDIIVHL